MKPDLQTISLCQHCSCPLSSWHGDSPVIFTEYRCGKHIIEQGEPTTGLHILCRGTAMVFGCNAHGDEYGLRMVGACEVIDLTDIILEESSYSISAKVLSDALVAFVRISDFRKQSATNLNFGMSLIQQAARHMKLLERQHGHLAHEDVCGRMLHFLRLLAEQGGEACGGGVRLPIKLQRSTLASMISTRPETISRLVTVLEDIGLIKYSDGQIVLLDLCRLNDATCCH